MSFDCSAHVGLRAIPCGYTYRSIMDKNAITFYTIGKPQLTAFPFTLAHRYFTVGVLL